MMSWQQGLNLAWTPPPSLSKMRCLCRELGMASRLSPAPSGSSRASGPPQDFLGGFRAPELVPSLLGGLSSEPSDELFSHARTAGQASTSGAPLLTMACLATQPNTLLHVCAGSLLLRPAHSQARYSAYAHCIQHTSLAAQVRSSQTGHSCWMRCMC